MNPAARRFRRNLRQEIDGAALYRALAEVESCPELAEVYLRLAAVEQAHAEFWLAHLREEDGQARAPAIGWRTRILIALARRLGPRIVLPTLARDETRNRGIYDQQPEARGSGMDDQERSHARLLAMLASPSAQSWNGGRYAQLEGRHRVGGGNVLRAAVLGANDGLVSTFCLIAGVAGADAAPQTLLTTAVAGALAGACSMAMGEWVSMQSARELLEREVATEADELAARPEEEMEELTLIYRAKGIPEDQAHSIARQVMANQESALDTLVKEELGINPDELGGSPYAAAASSFAVFLLGALVPVLPLLLVGAGEALIASLAASLLGLFALGAAITVFTGRNALVSGLRQAIIGIAAAAVTFGIGHLFGIAIAG
ncbi:VIT1/CCC1 transporter family protein [Niveibacterium terrae]|uniref:VIT1/CCC1 transporter family protein n=1 Tax=Niveibacterium terrae TaxID=3373598 RepID=UPI003A8F1ACE